MPPPNLPKVISTALLLWSQLLLVWSIAAYGITADPLKGEAAHFSWKRWRVLLACRVIFAVFIAYALSGSIILSLVVLVIVLGQPLLRYRFPLRWVAEFETCCIAVFLASSLALIRDFNLSTPWLSVSIIPARLAVLCMLASTLLVVVRGGTYIVRGVLRKCEVINSEEDVRSSRKEPARSEASEAQTKDLPAVDRSDLGEEPSPMTIDPEEYNRGRLIGNLERIVLTIVVAAGSYAALAFLVAAKGVVRSDEFEKNRDFTEYFLIGSLASILVALCGGIALRFAVVHLWPDLLTLQMQ